MKTNKTQNKPANPVNGGESTARKSAPRKNVQSGDISRNDLELRLNTHLEAARFKDYCPNGLQVEGRDEIRTLVTGVTASLALLDAAIAVNADAVLVHHGLFWRGDDARIVGRQKARIERLLAHGVSLFAYHLPLDAHPQLGNNAALGRELGLVADANFSAQNIGFIGNLKKATTAQAFADHVGSALKRTPLLVGDASRSVKRIAWCTGGAQGYFEDALRAGCDLYLSGEISEQTTHIARESGIPYIAAGHHATERYGVQAVGAWCAEEFGIVHRFIDVDNPA